MNPTATKSFPFAIRVEYVGTTVKDACKQAVELSRHTGCLIQMEINDVDLTVAGSIMTPEDVYAQWEYQQAERNPRRQKPAKKTLRKTSNE